MIRVLCGEDDFAVEERLRAIANAIGPQELREPNTSTFEGDGYTLEELLAAAQAVPFLAEQRLIIVKGLLGALDGGARGRSQRAARLPKGDWNELPHRLQGLPDTTELVFVEGPLRRGGGGLRAAGPTAEVETFQAKRGTDLQRWIRDRFTSEGCQATSGAVVQLADVVGPQPRLLAQEIRKLSLYAWGREVTPEDVELLAAPAKEANIFAAVDAVLEHQTATAVRLAYQLLDEGQSAQYILAMLARQLRMVIVAQDLRSEGASAADVAKRLGLRAESFPFRKTMDQARRYPFEFLAAAHRRLLEADLAMKSGTEERLGIELLIARLAA